MKQKIQKLLSFLKFVFSKEKTIFVVEYGNCLYGEKQTTFQYFFSESDANQFSKDYLKNLTLDEYYDLYEDIYAIVNKVKIN